MQERSRSAEDKLDRHSHDRPTKTEDVEILMFCMSTDHEDGAVCERRSYCSESSPLLVLIQRPVFQLSTMTADQTLMQTAALHTH